jgi:hypothetical protein
VVVVRWFYKGRHVKELLTAGRVTENGAYKQSSMESNIVATMRCYFKNDKGKMGDLELPIIASVKRYFEEPPPKRPVWAPFPILWALKKQNLSFNPFNDPKIK